MLVMKFGGTSVGDPARIVNVCDVVGAALRREPVAVVVSAASRVTDMLLDAVNKAVAGSVELTALRERIDGLLRAFSLDSQIVAAEWRGLEEALEAVRTKRSATDEDRDRVASFGERISVRTIAAVMTSRGMPARGHDAFDLGMVTDDHFGAAEPLPEADERIRGAVAREAKTALPVITGFIGKTADGRITTLGRGGSDYTAAIVGAAIDATEIQIWTDVDGVMSADPRVVPGARTIPILSFSEAAELAYFGAKVLHPKTILPAVRRDIPVRVLNTFHPESPGTVITAEGARPDASLPARAIAAKKGISVVQIVSSRMLLAHGFLARIFDVFARHEIVVDLVATSEVSVSLTVDRGDVLDAALEELRAIADVAITTDRALVAVVGRAIFDSLGIAGRVFGIMATAGVNIELISAGSGRANISMVVAGADADRAVRALHAGLFPETAA